MRSRIVAGGDVEIAAEHQQVLGHREVRIEVVALRHHADTAARLARVAAERPCRKAGCLPHRDW